MLDEDGNGPGASNDAETLAFWFVDLARTYETVAKRAREVGEIIRSLGIPAAIEEGAALRRFAASVCRLQEVVFTPLDALSKGEQTKP